MSTIRMRFLQKVASEYMLELNQKEAAKKRPRTQGNRSTRPNARSPRRNPLPAPVPILGLIIL